MSKHIVLCSDGTGNRDIKARGTNVFKLYEAVDIQGYKRPGGTAVPPQIAHYDDGVGSGSSWPARILGGAFGFGIARNVRQLYTELAHVYEPGDRIFLFGFSRGAYTVRTLSGMIQYCGVVDRARFPGRALERQVRACWSAFRGTFSRFVSDAKRRGERARPAPEDQAAREAADAARRTRLGAVVHATLAPGGKVPIHFIGVWDTVCAVGLPFDELRDFLNYFIYPIRFSDLTPGNQVCFARQALAIDDERRTFWPELWDERGAPPGRIEQVWFAGAHANVGGGYPKQGISLVALDWMMAHAELAGLRFIPDAREFARRHQDVHDKLYDSRSGPALYYRWNPRDIAKHCRAHGIDTPRVHVSVFERIAQGSAGYAPGNIPFAMEVAATPEDGPSPWPGGAALSAIASQVRGTAPADSATSPLARHAFEIRLGKLSYYAFLLATLLVIAGLTVSKEGVRVPPALASLIPFGESLLRAIEWARAHAPDALRAVPLRAYGWAFAAAFVLAWGLSAFVDRRLERAYSDFWHPLRDGIRDEVV